MCDEPCNILPINVIIFYSRLWQTLCDCDKQITAGFRGETCWTNAEVSNVWRTGRESSGPKKQCDHMQNIVPSKIFTIDITYW